MGVYWFGIFAIPINKMFDFPVCFDDDDIYVFQLCVCVYSAYIKTILNKITNRCHLNSQKAIKQDYGKQMTVDRNRKPARNLILKWNLVKSCWPISFVFVDESRWNGKSLKKWWKMQIYSYGWQRDIHVVYDIIQYLSGFEKIVHSNSFR